MIPESKYLYLFINLFVISIPLLRSFESRVAFYKGFKSLGLAILVTGGFFLIWDVIFTHMEIWGFNPKYLSGISLLGLPLGEYLFFVTVPFACVFTYKSLSVLIKKDLLGKYAKTISNFLIGFSFTIAAMYYDRWYTVTTFIFLGSFISFLQYREKPVWLGRFYLAYAVCLIPFFLVNGILTGTGITEEIVWYNNAENLGIRMGTIPFEDTFYGLLLILGTTYWYERFGKNKAD